MEVNKENIEFMKRRLRDYGYYTNAIINSEIKLFDLRERIHDCYKASGISYDGVMNNSNPNYSRTVELINSEYSELLHKEELLKERSSLGLDKLLTTLTEEQYDLIELHYFKGYTQNFIAVNKQYNSRERLTKKIRRIIINLVKKY